MKNEIKITLEFLQDIKARQIVIDALIKQAKKSDIRCVTITPSEVNND